MRYGYFDSNITGQDELGLPIFDRAENSEFQAKLQASFFTNGVIANPSTSFQVTENSSGGLKVEVKPGAALIEGRFAWEESPRTLVLQAAESLDRIDKVVLRLDLAKRTIDLAVVKGVAASVPVSPKLTRPESGQGGDIYELGLADILVLRNSTAVAQNRITDLRLDSSQCGYVHSPNGRVDTTDIFMQYQDALDKYLETVNAAIGGTVYGQIVNQIKSKTVTSSLRVGSWQGSQAPYIYELSVSGVTSTSNQEVVFTDDATLAQIEVAQGANIVNGVARTGVIVLRAFGEKPTIDIPVKVILRGDK